MFQTNFSLWWITEWNFYFEEHCKASTFSWQIIIFVEKDINSCNSFHNYLVKIITSTLLWQVKYLWQKIKLQYSSQKTEISEIIWIQF